MGSVTYDYIIVGGSLAGCVLASRLHQYEEDAKIVLIEAGPDTRTRPDTPNPQTLNLGGDLDWNYESEPIPGYLNRTIPVNAGKGVAAHPLTWVCGGCRAHTTREGSRLTKI